MKELKFIHITKSGGSSIEEIGKSNKVYWGKYDNLFKEINSHYHNISEYIPLHIQNKYDWFLVVRNPYERILSEYYCNWGGIGEFVPSINHNINEFNIYIIKKILNYHKSMDSPNTRSRFHYIPQYLYLMENANSKMNILKIENLEQDFNNLMKKYKLNIHLNKHINKSKFKKKFTVDHFSNELIDLINCVYRKDFEEFNYKMIIPTKQYIFNKNPNLSIFKPRKIDLK